MAWYVGFWQNTYLVAFCFFMYYLAQYIVCYSYISKKLKKIKKTLANFIKMVYNVIKVVESGGKRLKGGRKNVFW